MHSSNPIGTDIVGHAVGHGSGTVWIEPDRVSHGILKTLLAAKIPFCGFDGNVSQEKLNLLEFTSRLMAESCSCPAQVMWSKAHQTAVGGSVFHDGPDHLGRETVSPHSSCFVDGSKERT
jgi:hypothetical protein